MKKMLNCALIYAIAAMVGGVFYREFTKFSGFSGVTALSKVHAHLFMLGMLVFLVVALFCAHTKLQEEKQFKLFFKLYNIGLPLTAIMLLVRGTLQVVGTELSKGADAAISGVAGIGHIILGVAIVLLIQSMKKVAKN